MWQHWTNAVLGVVLVAIAFVGLSDPTLNWTLGILGAVIVLLGLWGGVSKGDVSHTSPKSV